MWALCMWSLFFIGHLDVSGAWQGLQFENGHNEAHMLL